MSAVNSPNHSLSSFSSFEAALLIPLPEEDQEPSESSPTAQSSLESELLADISFFDDMLLGDRLLEERELDIITDVCKGALDKAAALPDVTKFKDKYTQVAILIEKMRQTRRDRQAFDKMLAEAEDSPKNLLSIVRTSKHATALLEEAEAVVAKCTEYTFISLQFKSDPGLRNGAAAYFQIGVIEIEESLPLSQKLPLFLFELTNLINSQRHARIDEAVIEGTITDKMTYARCCTKVEYDGLQKLKKTVQSCMDEEGWSDILLPIGYHSWETFEECYENMIQTGHSEEYYQAFERLRNSAQPSASTEPTQDEATEDTTESASLTAGALAPEDQTVTRPVSERSDSKVEQSTKGH